MDWLVSKDIVLPTLSNCILSSNNGYAISKGAKGAILFSENLLLNHVINGLEIITERQIFHTGENGMDECLCPHCKKNIAAEDWDFFNDWVEQKNNNLTCPLCNVATDIHQFTFSPEWGFSDLGFTFWNCSDLKNDFILEFKQKLDCDVALPFFKQ